MILLLIKFFIIFVFLPSSLGKCDDKPDGSTLRFVQTVWRHGDRTPTQTFSLDKNQATAWPQGFGELTERGMRQHLDLGKTLRHRYVECYGFLSPEYNSSEIYVRSTDVNRTMISAIANLIAMYPGYKNKSGITYPNVEGWPTYHQDDGSEVGFVPIPIHTVNDFYDYTLNPDMICPRQDQLWKLVEQTPEYQEETKNKADLLKTVSMRTGEDTTLTNLWLIADALFIE
uniref:Uncharacterized protein n=1 Tax=Panagrolaimus sp. ES5 TaxID=591445 RepID=A0AC34GDV1_9BILA